MSDSPPATVLFLCTGNYYRSRFAETLFNLHTGHLPALPVEVTPDATRPRYTHLKPRWRADSAGLAAHNYGYCNIGPLSPDAYRALFDRKIDMSPGLRPPRQVTVEELARYTKAQTPTHTAGRVIALKETEHRPMMRDLHPDYEDRIEYWEVHDVPPSSQYDPMQHVEDHVLALLEELS